jgi:hypothetical protein
MVGQFDWVDGVSQVGLLTLVWFILGQARWQESTWMGPLGRRTELWEVGCNFNGNQSMEFSLDFTN